MTENRRTLLIIDDDTLVRRSIAVYLEDSGYHVAEAADAADEAVASVEDAVAEAADETPEAPAAEEAAVNEEA